LEEAEYLCDRIAMINRGRIVVVDTPENLKREFGKIRKVEMRAKHSIPDDFIMRLMADSSFDRVSRIDPQTVSVICSTPGEAIAQMLRLADKFRLEIVSIYAAEPSLEDVFIGIITSDA
ncbi:MAG: hypothetical protein QXD32_07115, partial [Nitrososphaerota archaeon]